MINVLNVPDAPVPNDAAINKAADRIRSFFLPKLSLSQPEMTAPARQPINAQLIAQPCNAALFVMPKYGS